MLPTALKASQKSDVINRKYEIFRNEILFFKSELAPFRYGSSLLPLLETHPELALYANKGESLRIEEKWKMEKLKPKLNLEYHFLNKDLSEGLPSYFSTNNYK